MPLSRLANQQQLDTWLPLRNDASQLHSSLFQATGELHIRARFLYSDWKILSDAVEGDKKLLKKLECERDACWEALEQLKAPFATENMKVSVASILSGPEIFFVDEHEPTDLLSFCWLFMSFVAFPLYLVALALLVVLRTCCDCCLSDLGISRQRSCLACQHMSTDHSINTPTNESATAHI